jgi:myo-inositol-1(or 4)-monophosphatase
MGPRVFFAEKGKSTRIYMEGKTRKPKLSNNTNLELMSWSMTVPARPADIIFPTAARLIDVTSLKGGFFACNSTAYSLTRLVTNQLDACVDFANRFLRDISDVVEDEFINAGRGIVLGICPYDIGAAWLIAKQAGCSVTDAYGKPFDDVLLLDSSVSNQRSLIAAANDKLHAKLMEFFGKRIPQYESLFKRRAALRARVEAGRES